MVKHGLIEHNSSYSFTIDPDTAGQRVDIFLASQFTHYSRSYFQRLIDSHSVAINGVMTKKQGTALKEGDTVTVSFPEEQSSTEHALKTVSMPIECLHKDEHFLVVAKAANVVTHKPKSNYAEPTLVDWLTSQYQEIAAVGYIDRPGIVHRLDKDTSGLLLIARTNHGRAVLSQLFKKRTIKKTYVALVQGHPPREGSIDMPIGRHPVCRTKMTTFTQKIAPDDTQTTVRHALTYYEVLHYFDTCSLVKVMPVTGRTHQIRVHFSAIGHPLLGDLLYHKGSPIIDRQALHAHALTFSFDGKEYSFTSNPPQDFLDALRALSTQSQEPSTTPIPFINSQ